MRKLILVICLLAAIAGMAAAQDDVVETCDTSSALATITELVADIELEPLDILRAIKAAVDEILMQCNGLTFTSENEGRQPVLGPITLDEGLWRVTVNTTGYYIAKLTVLDGTCDTRSFGSLFLLTAGQGENAQALIESEGCEALIEISNVTADWTLGFENLR